MTQAEEDAAANRAAWTRTNAEYTDEHATRAWAADEITWGLFNVPESALGVLGDVAGLDVVELGCGTAYFSSWLARRGARPVGVDLTPAQLATARRCQRQFGVSFPLVEADARAVPLPSASFDLAFSEYGACLWCDPIAHGKFRREAVPGSRESASSRRPAAGPDSVRWSARMLPASDWRSRSHADRAWDAWQASSTRPAPGVSCAVSDAARTRARANGASAGAGGCAPDRHSRTARRRSRRWADRRLPRRR